MISSLSFPNLFDVSRNKVGVLTNKDAVANRCRLLMLTEPTELYNYPTFGVGLKQYLFQYNTENTKAILKDRIKNQFRTYEPDCNANNTSFADGLLVTGENEDTTVQDFNTLKLTVGIQTVLGDDVEVTIDGE
jgi:phage baseplate assembly protein W